MKRMFCCLLALLLVCTLLPPLTSPVSAKIVIEDEPELDLDFEIIDIKPSPTPPDEPGLQIDVWKLVKGPLKMLAVRAWQELGAYCISNDVPGFSTFFKLLQSPAQRATLARQQMLTQVVADISEIKATVGRIESQLQDVSDKMDMYATAAAFNESAEEYKSITSKYAAAWAQYAAMYEYANLLAGEQEILNQYKKQDEELKALETQKKTLEESLANETDSEKKAQIQKELDDCVSAIADFGVTREALDGLLAYQQSLVNSRNAQIDDAQLRFISICEEGGGFTFASDLSALTSIIWNTDNPTGSYLGSYEAYLRERYALEHEITPALSEAFDCAVAAQVQILTIYTEYYTYKQQVNPSNAIYRSYDEEYFTKVQEKIISNCNAIAELSGFDKLMITEDYTEEELAEFREYDEDFVPPENIHQTVTIGGKTYNCYKVRDNKDLCYYLILTDFVSNKDHVRKFSPVYAISSISNENVLDIYGKHIYRPRFTFDHAYTDDYAYQIVTADSVPAFLTEDGILSTNLRTVSGLKNIAQETKYVMFADDEIVNHGHFAAWNGNVYWKMKFLDMEQDGSQDLLSVSSVDVYNDSKYTKSLLVYRQTATDEYYANDNRTWALVDKGEIAGKTISVRNGQTLDMSAITVDIPNVTINVLGEATIISNPNITLTNSKINIVTDEKVTIQDLKLTGQLHQKAPIEVHGNAEIVFMGNCTFTARSETLTGLKLYEHYVPGQPVFASHGMYVAKGVTAEIRIYGHATFKGTHGGAGVCTDGTAIFFGRSPEQDKLTAYGSALLEDSIDSELYGDYAPAGVGAGLGASYSSVVRAGHLKDLRYDLVGDTGRICTSNLTVDARGAKPGFYGGLRAEDIGGILESGENHPHSGGWLSGSTVHTKSHQISSNIATAGMGSIYKPDEYTITVSTKGSNAVTNDGIWINVIGTNGMESGWMKASDLGNDRGETKQTLIGNSVGEIKEIRVKTVSGNHWYPNKVTVSTKYSGDSFTVYGGRWIGTTEQTLSPTDNVYRVTITTSSDSNAGTDANITLFLQDDNGTVTETIDLSDIHYESNAFEKGDVEDFFIYAPKDFGECRHAFLRSDHSGSAPGWKVQKINISKVQNGTDGYSITPDYWYEYAATVNFGKYSGKTGAYKIEVKTGGASGAGTDSNIRIELHGNAYSKDTGYINMSDMAGSGQDFEKNYLDCFKIGFNVNGIGDVQSISIDKDNGGSGPNWYLSYIKLTEIVADGQQAKEYIFTYNGWIKTDPVTIQRSSGTTVKAESFIDREILEKLEILEDGTYQLTVDRTVTVSEEILATLQETGKKLTIIMTNGEKPIYAVSFDGTQITDYYSVTLSKSYGFADGNVSLDLLSGNPLPAGTVVRIYAENLGFQLTDKLVLWAKDELGAWVEDSVLVNEDGMIHIPLKGDKELLISKLGADLPAVEPDPEDIPGTGDVFGFAVPLLILAAAMLMVMLQKKRMTK